MWAGWAGGWLHSGACCWIFDVWQGWRARAGRTACTHSRPTQRQQQQPPAPAAAARTRAPLPAVAEGALDNVLCRRLDVGVCAHNGGILASQLHLQGSKRGQRESGHGGQCGAAGETSGRTPIHQQHTTDTAHHTTAQRTHNEHHTAPHHTWMGTMAALRQMSSPVSPPVKEIALTRGCVVRKSPISLPRPAGGGGQEVWG